MDICQFLLRRKVPVRDGIHCCNHLCFSASLGTEELATVNPFETCGMPDYLLQDCDWEAYLARYADLRALGIQSNGDAKQHFLSQGRKEGRQCTQQFKPLSADTFFQLNSNCSSAIDIDYYQKIRSNNSYYSHASYPSGDTRVSLVDAGSGTTGTRYLFKVACQELRLTGTRGLTRCNTDASNDVLILREWWRQLFNCVTDMNISTSAACKSEYLLRKLHSEAFTVFKSLDVMMDTPMDAVYAEFSSYTQHNAVGIISLRDPKEWFERRNELHQQIFLHCREILLDNAGVRHPFDAPGCLQHSEYAFEALYKASDAQRIIEGYRRMNAYNAAITNKLHLMCLWDERSRGENAKKELVSIYDYFSSHNL